ncbi:uncharacterized protein LOC110427677 [Herrania umbratica]|uniref:Uncharacterized protein LOC110427677 n=1 Tax=Herrania umbratica TaxID=108875 RepID=A0A6J1BKV7_9ROSI|nr:uncharacterized protein LOC110427677 [Herrania umbratica]
MALFLIVNNILFGQYYRRLVILWLLSLVKNINEWNVFTWGTYVWSLTTYREVSKFPQWRHLRRNVTIYTDLYRRYSSGRRRAFLLSKDNLDLIVSLKTLIHEFLDGIARRSPQAPTRSLQIQKVKTSFGRRRPFLLSKATLDPNASL